VRSASRERAPLAANDRASQARVGRTLLSDGFDLRIPCLAERKVKGVGEECPTHIGLLPGSDTFLSD
jgi:hypothetical protein